MISAKDLTEEQRSAMEQWASEGAQLPDLQQRLKGQFGITLTYMDTRFLVLDLGLEIHSEEADDEEDGDNPPADGPDFDADSDVPGPRGGLRMTIDEVVRPGAIVSGKVTFSDGETGIWMIDHAGRPALDPGSPDYQPSEEDMIAMERELRRILQQFR
jgi:hypothetical protein